MFDRDFDGLAEGDSFVTAGRTVTETDIVSFACLTGDMHPQHTDRAWAASSLFGERVAHGMLVASFAIGMLPLDPERVIALRRVRDAVFKRPVAIGDTLHVAGRVDRLDEVNAVSGIVVVRMEVLNQRSLAVARMGVEVLWRRGAVAGAGSLPTLDEPFELAGLPI